MSQNIYPLVSATTYSDVIVRGAGAKFLKRFCVEVQQMHFLMAIILLVFLLPAVAHAAQDNDTPIVVVAPQIPWLLDSKNPGPYNDLLDEFLPGFETPLEVSILPPRRARRAFFNGTATCFFPGSQDSIFHESREQHRDSLLVSMPFNSSYIRAFTLTNTPPLKTLESIGEAQLAVDLSLSAVEYLVPSSIALIRPSDMTQAHALVSQGRAAAALLVAYDYELFAARTPNAAPLHYDDTLEFGVVDDALMCKKSDGTQALIDHVNARVKALIEDDRLAQILKPDYARSKRQFAERRRPYLLRLAPESE